MAAPVFTTLPTPPNRETDPDSFSVQADAFLGALPTFQTEGNTLGAYCETQAGVALGHANDALGYANDALGYATDAATYAATISSTITVYTNEASFNAATPATGQLFVLSL